MGPRRAHRRDDDPDKGPHPSRACGHLNQGAEMSEQHEPAKQLGSTHSFASQAPPDRQPTERPTHDATVMEISESSVRHLHLLAVMR